MFWRSCSHGPRNLKAPANLATALTKWPVIREAREPHFATCSYGQRKFYPSVQ